MRIVSVSRYVPFEGIPHAGGEQYRRHLAALRALGHHVTVVAPRTPENVAAAVAMSDEVVLFGPISDGSRPSWGDSLARLWQPHALPMTLRRALARDADYMSLVAAADVVEAQWTEMSFSLRLAGGRPSVLYAHDVLTQREARWLMSAWRSRQWRKAMWRSWRYLIVRICEPRDLCRADFVVALSEKDATLIRRITHGRRVTQWIDPPLVTDDQVLHEDDGEHVAVFVAAFSRGENVEAALWLVDSVWPRVHAEVPSARLILAGAAPPPALIRAAEQIPGVEVTGYLESLEPVYAEASVSLVPLLSGAGVKFKAIEGIVRDIPVVATSVGAEGIGGPDGTPAVVVADTEDEFVEAVVRALTASDADAIRHIGRWARGKYSTTGYRDRIAALLAELPSFDAPSPR